MAETKIIRRFDSVSEFADYVEPDSTTDAYEGANNSSRDAASHWNGMVDWAGALEFARHGWSEEHDALQGMLQGLNVTLEQVMSLQFEQVWGVEGGAVDIDRFINGDPENMVMFQQVNTTATHQVVKILVSTGVLADVDADAIRLRGLAVCCLIEMVQRSGKAVELWAESTCQGNKGQPVRHTTLVKVKEAGSYLDLDQIMFAMVHPAWHRHLVFGCREQEAANIRIRGGFGGGHGVGYGKTTNPVMAEAVEASIVLPTLRDGDRNFRSVDSAVEWIKMELTKLGLTKVEA